MYLKTMRGGVFLLKLILIAFFVLSNHYEGCVRGDPVPTNPKMFDKYTVLVHQRAGEDITLYVDNLKGQFRGNLVTETFGPVSLFVYKNDTKYYTVIGPEHGPYMCIAKSDGEVTSHTLDLVGTHAKFTFDHQEVVDKVLCNFYKNDSRLYLNDAVSGYPVEDRTITGEIMFSYAGFLESVDDSKFVMPVDKSSCLPLSDLSARKAIPLAKEVKAIFDKISTL